MNIDANSPLPSPPLPRWLVAVLTIAVFAWLDTFHLDLFRQLAGASTGTTRLAWLAALGYAPHLLAAWLFAAALVGPRHALALLGLAHAPLRGLAVAVALTAPLAVGYALAFPPAALEAPGYEFGRTALLPGLGEEILYRGLLFGVLFRLAGWGFLPAALLGAVLFGAAHLYQGNDWQEAAFIFGLTAVGSVWFAWLYVEWRFNLWLPIGLHVLMNAYWTAFDVSDNANGPWWTTALRVGVIVLSIVVTVIAARRRGGRVLRGAAWGRGSGRHAAVATS